MDIPATSDNIPGTLVLRDSSGTFSGRLGPIFRAFAESTTVTTSGVLSVVTLDSETFDTDNTFESSQFTPNVAGYYLINGTITWLSLAAITKAKASILKNGVIASEGDESNAFRVSVADVIYMNGTTDYIQLGATQASGTSKTVQSGSSNTYLSGFLIGA